MVGLSSPVPKPVCQQAVPAGTTDWGTVVKAALAGDPDTVYWAGSAAGGGALLAALRDAGYDGAFVASAAVGEPGVPAAAGDAAEGAFVIAPASAAEPARGGRSGRARFETRFGHEPGLDALQAYDGVRALAQAVTQSGKVDRERNSEELTVLDEGYTTFLGDAGLAFASDHTIKYDNNIVLKVEGGAFAVDEHAALGRGG